MSGPNAEHEHVHGEEHGHGHGHGHDGDGHGHRHGHPEAAPDTTRTILLEQDVLAKNDALARANREWLTRSGILALNLMSSPGSGKTTLLERTLRGLGAKVPVTVIEGDQETLLDADRLRRTGCSVVQINTGAGCHLDADMLSEGLRRLQPPQRSVVFIENVGNLVCPALFDLGEHHKVVIASVTEGEDKPLKYPHMFRSTDLVLLNKVDLLPYLDFDVETFVAHAKQVNPDVEVVPVSATKGDGVPTWYEWLNARIETS